jgi:mRNA interferase RelE/StbE
MIYTVVITEYAIRQLKKLPPQVVGRIKEAIAALANEPRPYNHIKLTNLEAYRIRVGDYRIIYEIQDNILTVTVVDVSNRKDAYKKR